MPDTLVNSDELTEVVYLPEVAKVRDPRFEGLNERVKKLEENKSKKDNWLKRNVYWVAPLATLIFGSGAVAYVAGLIIDHRIDTKLTSPLARITEQDKSIAKMDGRLEGIGAMLTVVTQNEIRRVANLKPSDFDTALPEVSTVLTVATTENVPRPDLTLNAIRANLVRSKPQSPGFWGAAGAVITYQSGPGSDALPDCLATPPSVTPSTPPPTIPITDFPAVYQNCQIELDSVEAAMKKNFFLRLVEFRNCTVIYRGGQFAFPEGGYWRFVDCSFELLVKQPPAAPGQKFIHSLLAAQDLRSVKISISGA